MSRKNLFSHTDATARLTKVNGFDPLVTRVAQQQQISHIIIKAVMAVESSGNPLAGIERSTGAKGLMQIIDQTWRNTIQRFPHVFFQNQPLTKYLNREENNYWQNPELNILIGALALKLKCDALTKQIGTQVNINNPSDMMLVLTCYNAGEFTVATAYNYAKQGGSRQPSYDFINPEYLTPAIQTVVTRFKLGWNVEKKVEEISEYAYKVLEFMDLLQQQQNFPNLNINNTQPNRQNTQNANNGGNNTAPVNNNANNNANNTNSTANNTATPYVVVAGDTGIAIARKLNVSFELLQRANPAVVWSRLSIGQKIIRPASSTTTQTTTTTNNSTNNNRPNNPPRSHLVKRGDNLSTLASLYKTTEAALKAANPTKLKRWGDVEGFAVGDTIIII